MSESSLRPPEWARPIIRMLAERVIEAATPAARSCGYALAVHGSLERDVDLIAVPWTEEAQPAEQVVEAICGAVSESLGYCTPIPGKGATLKAHGRMVWTLTMHGGVIATKSGQFPFIDLGVMPRTAS